MKVAHRLFCILWLGSFGAKAQQLQGVFALDSVEGRNRLNGQIFAFAGSRFAHSVVGCVSGTVDTGCFTYRNDTLTLRYDTWQQAASTFSSIPLTKHAGNISLIILDAETKKAVQNIVVVDIKSRARATVKYTITSTTTISIDQTLPPTDTLSIECGGYVSSNLPVSSLVGRATTVLLAPKIYRAPSGTITSYLLQLQAPGFFALHILEPAIPWAYYYRRLPPKQAEQLLSNLMH